MDINSTEGTSHRQEQVGFTGDSLAEMSTEGPGLTNDSMNTTNVTGRDPIQVVSNEYERWFLVCFSGECFYTFTYKDRL